MRHLANSVIRHEQQIRQACAYRIPEGSQLSHTVLRRIACNDRRIDRSDGYARDPIDFYAIAVQLLIDARLVRAERSSAL